MKHNNGKKTLFRICLVLMAFITTLGLMAFTNPTVVLAQDTVTPGQPGKPDFSKLEELYQKELSTLDKLGGFLANGENAISKVQDVINRGTAKGLDTSSLTAALAAFESALASAQGSYGTAASILASHDGFNGAGKVMDRAAAVQTLKNAGSAMKSAGSTLKAAGSALKSAVDSWIQTNKGAITEKLSQIYQKEQEWLSTQETNIGKLGDAAGQMANFIEKARERGEDTSSLESVVADINAQLPQSQSYHNTAASILANHAGFDASGNVTDSAAAKTTLENAKSSLESSKNINVQLAEEIKAALSAWKVNHPKDTVQDIGGE